MNKSSPSLTSPSTKSGNSPLFRFPVRRNPSSESTNSSSAYSTVSSILDSRGRRSSSSASSTYSNDSDSEKEFVLKEDIKSHCIGKEYCKCEHCHIGDFTFDTPEEFLIYYEALKDVLEAKEGGNPIQIHCSLNGGTHMHLPSS